MIWLVALCAISFIAAVALFLWTSAMRRELGDVLAAAAQEGGATPRRLGMFDRWEPHGGPVVLAIPERRWTYERDYMRAFIDAIAGTAVPEQPGESWLSVYAGPILGRDMAFAVSFACFIVFAWAIVAVVLPPDCLGGWAPRACLLLAALGAVYGVADVAEDVKLRRIFRNARAVRAKTGGAAAPPSDSEIESEPLDDAEIDAANALTRIKLLTIPLSIIGGIVFGLLMVVSGHLPRRGAAKSS